MSTITIAPNSAHPLTVNRLGYGTMRLTGPDIWGEPADRPQALEILKTAVAQRRQFPRHGRLLRRGRDQPPHCRGPAPLPGRPGNLHQSGRHPPARQKLGALQHARKPAHQHRQQPAHPQQEQIQLVHLRLIGHGGVPLDEQLGRHVRAAAEGKILHVGLSNVSRAELEAGLHWAQLPPSKTCTATASAPPCTLPHGENPGGEEVLDLCEQHGIPLIPFFSLVHSLPKADDKMAEIARSTRPPRPR